MRNLLTLEFRRIFNLKELSWMSAILFYYRTLREFIFQNFQIYFFSVSYGLSKN